MSAIKKETYQKIERYIKRALEKDLGVTVEVEIEKWLDDMNFNNGDTFVYKMNSHKEETKRLEKEKQEADERADLWREKFRKTQEKYEQYVLENKKSEKERLREVLHDLVDEVLD